MFRQQSINHPSDGWQHLPEGWKSTVRMLDQALIGSALFVSSPAKGCKWRDVLTTHLCNWWYPPKLVHTARPNPAAYFAQHLFLCMPRNMWLMRVTCPNCRSHKELWSRGLDNRVRRVIDVTDVYYMAAEYMDCRSCKETKDKTDRMEMSLMVCPCSGVQTHVCGQSCVLLWSNQSCDLDHTRLRSYHATWVTVWRQDHSGDSELYCLRCTSSGNGDGYEAVFRTLCQWPVWTERCLVWEGQVSRCRENGTNTSKWVDDEEAEGNRNEPVLLDEFPQASVILVLHAASRFTYAKFIPGNVTHFFKHRMTGPVTTLISDMDDNVDNFPNITCELVTRHPG